MKQRSINNCFIMAVPERGAVLVFSIFAVLLFLVLAGLAVDSANLFRTQLRTQRAVDAATVRGTYLLTSTSNRPAILNSVLEVARDNLAHSGILDSGRFNQGQQIRARIPGAARELFVDGNSVVPIMLLNSTPWFRTSSTNLVAASAVGESATAAISIILDTTGSMNCPATGSCAYRGNASYCSSNWNTNECRSRGTRRIDELKIATSNFVAMFDPDLDEVAITTFSTAATVQKTMGHFNMSSINSVINGLTASGLTDLQVGLQVGAQQLAHALNPMARKVAVFLTDGAPNRSQRGVCAGATSKQLHYIRAIQEADASRSAYGGTFYVIGLGIPNGSDPGRDPYQDVNDDYGLKQNLLRRMANAQEAQIDPLFPCVDDYSSYNNNNPSFGNGEFLETPDATQLQDLFQQIGRSIKARLKA